MHDSVKPFSINTAKFKQELKNFGDSIINPYKKKVFSREFLLLRKKGLMSKLAFAQRLAEILYKCEISTGMGNALTIPSFIFYLLKISRANPLAHELVFEAQIDHSKHSLPIGFSIGASEKDRIISILQYSANFKHRIIPCTNTLSAMDEIVIYISQRNDPLEDDFLIRTGNGICYTADLKSETAGNKVFTFYLDRKVDIVESSLRMLHQKKGIYLTAETIPLDDENTLNNLRLMDDIGKLELENKLPLLKMLASFNLPNFETMLALYALYSENMGGSERFEQLMCLLNGKTIPNPYNYHCLSLLEETRGLLVYREQLLHILHFIGGLSYSDAAVFYKDMQQHDFDAIEKKGRPFLQYAENAGIPSASAHAILTRLYANSRHVVSRSEALAAMYPIYFTSFFKVNFPDVYSKALSIYCE